MPDFSEQELSEALAQDRSDSPARKIPLTVSARGMFLICSTGNNDILKKTPSLLLIYKHSRHIRSMTFYWLNLPITMTMVQPTNQIRAY